MAEYIDREEYCETHCPHSNEHCDKPSCPIWKAPAVDVAPVRHGEWLLNEKSGYYIEGCYYEVHDWECSECGAVVSDRRGLPKACPGCGAVM